MSFEPKIPNIEEFLDYNSKTDAEFAAAIGNLEHAIYNCVKRLDINGAWNLTKLKRKFDKLAFKRQIEKEKKEFRELRRKH